MMWAIMRLKVGSDASLFLRYSVQRIRPAVSAPRSDLPLALQGSCLREFVTFNHKNSPLRVWERSFSSDGGNSSCSLTEPEISKLGISEAIVCSLKFGLLKTRIPEIKRESITHLKPIQKEVFEPAMQGRDIIAQASKGGGKTLAFGLPILDNITKFREKNGFQRDKGDVTCYPLALVLSPNREAAVKVKRVFSQAARNIDSVCVDGEIHLGIHVDPKTRGSIELELTGAFVDVVIGTPGRVIDVVEELQLSLSKVQYVVLDDVDIMVSEGLEKDVEDVLDRFHQKPQMMIFGASLPNWITKLREKYLEDPFEVADVAVKAAKGIDWDGMAKLIVSEEARKEFFNLRRAFDEVNSTLQAKFSQEPEPIDWEYYRKGIGSRLVDMYKEAYEGIEIPKYVDTVTPQYKPKFDALLVELKEAEHKSLEESKRLEEEIAEVQKLKKNISTMTADDYFKDHPELKKKFDDEIRNDYWGY